VSVRADAGKMREVTVGTVNALTRKGGEPSAAGGMKVGNNVDFALGWSGGSATRCGNSAAGCCSKKTEKAAPVHRVPSTGIDEWGRRSVCESAGADLMKLAIHRISVTLEIPDQQIGLAKRA